MRIALLCAAACSSVLLASGCGNASTSAAPDTNPGGDIPDSQAYVSFTVPSGAFSIKVPEGWARTDKGGATTFTDKLNLIRLEAIRQPVGPTVESVDAVELPAIKAETRGFRSGTVAPVQRPGGSAILVTYQADSPSNPVTGKVVREAVTRYEFWRNGTEAVVTLSSPTTADNVDPWRIVADSFRWSA
jgi:hypothetical protein